MDDFICACCGEDIVHHANPLSAKKSDSLVKHLTQCQFCMKSKADGVILFKCSGCFAGLYCSKECQKKGWPAHKIKCKLNQNARSAHPIAGDKIEKMRSFTSKHRPTLAEAGLRALDLGNYPDNAKENVLAVIVRERPAKRAELSYYAIDADVIPLETFGKKAAEMREQLKIATEHNKQTGCDGTFFVVLRDVSANLNNIVLVGYPYERAYPVRRTWKEWMMKHLNEGILN